MSLFKNLLKLYPVPRRTEDFFTEIIVHLFNNQKDLAVAWLGNIGAISLNEAQSYTFFSATSQQTYSGLEHHANDSRPDIVIQLDSQGQRTLIFVESKIGSTQNPSQLTNYAEILCQENGFDRKALVYITRSFEAIDDFQEKAQASNFFQQFNFIQTRWHLFHRFIDSYKENYLIQEIQAFMREEKMNQDNQFSAADILAMSHFNHALSIVEETLKGEVEGKLRKIFPNQRMSSFLEVYKNFRIWPRLAYHVDFIHPNFKLMLGYFDLNFEGALLYPDVKICLQLHKILQLGKKLLFFWRRLQPMLIPPGRLVGKLILGNGLILLYVKVFKTFWEKKIRSKRFRLFSATELTMLSSSGVNTPIYLGMAGSYKI